MAEVVNLAAYRETRGRDDEGPGGEEAAEHTAHSRDAGEGGETTDDDEAPHGWAHGAAKCMCCAHEWVAVAPAGTVFLACPACDCEQGRWQYPFRPRDDSVVFECCNCGAQEFYCVAAGAGEGDIPLLHTSGGASHDYYLLCAGCGVDMKF